MASGGEVTPEGMAMVRQAVQEEKQRIPGKKTSPLADTEQGRSLQEQMGASAALANRHVQQFATEVLKRSPVSGPKQ